MKVSDFIVEFLIQKGVKHTFGYPGGMVIHLMDSFAKYENQIQTHVCYHEQAAAFEACAYAQVSGGVGVAYATSGPGATNMITGICNAYFDSVPVIFITGQVNTFESGKTYGMRQRGFQETDIVAMVEKVTKYAVYVEDADKIGYYLEKAYQIANSGRKGPVLLDIPMNIQRAGIGADFMASVEGKKEAGVQEYSVIVDMLRCAKRPCIVLGAALKQVPEEFILDFADHMGIPIVTSMISVDLLPYDDPYNYGFFGAYGRRAANFILAKSDVILSFGCRMDVRQVGGKRECFAPNAKIVRVDIDENELAYRIRRDDVGVKADAAEVMQYLLSAYVPQEKSFREWQGACRQIADKLNGIDDRIYNHFVEKISQYVPENVVITTDVGQNQVWVAQSYRKKAGQKILFSGGHGAMGYSLPAAIGAYYATGKPVVSFNGDGGIQMNIQELEFIRREKLPIKVIVFNNYALGMIRHFQEMYLESNYAQTVIGKGYDTPDFAAIAKAYGMEYVSYEKPEEVSELFMLIEGPVLVEIKLREETYVFPKLEFGKPNQDQEPLLDRALFQELMEL